MAFDVRQNTEAPCTLEKSDDSGETWAAWADLQLCPPQVVITPQGTVQWWNPVGTPGGPPGGHTGTGAWEPLPIDPDATTDTTIPPGSVPYPPGSPEYEAGTGKCQAAANLAEVLMNDALKMKDFAIGSSHTVATLLGILAILTLLVAAPIALVGLALILVGYATDLSTIVYDDVYAEIDWSRVRDMLFCCMGADGSMTDGSVNKFVNLWSEAYPDNLIVLFMIWLVRSIPVSVLNDKAGLTADVIEPTCTTDECEWSHEFSFVFSEEGWIAESAFTHWVGLNGFVANWPSTDNIVFNNTVTGYHLTSIQFTGSAPLNPTGASHVYAYNLDRSVLLADSGVGVALFELNVNADIDTGLSLIFDPQVGTGYDWGGNGIQALVLHGLGDDPFI